MPSYHELEEILGYMLVWSWCIKS